MTVRERIDAISREHFDIESVNPDRTCVLILQTAALHALSLRECVRAKVAYKRALWAVRQASKSAADATIEAEAGEAYHEWLEAEAAKEATEILNASLQKVLSKFEAETRVL